MQGGEILAVFVDGLNKSKLKYMVTGSIASIIYGEPRMTHDVDIVLELGVENIDGFLELYPLSGYYCPSKEIILQELVRPRHGHFNIIHHDTGFKADIYPSGSDDLHKWAMQKRVPVQFGMSEIYIAPPEYVIIRKLQFYKEGGSDKHLRDVKQMLEISSEKIDTDVLNEKAFQSGVSDLLRTLL